VNRVCATRARGAICAARASFPGAGSGSAGALLAPTSASRALACLRSLRSCAMRSTRPPLRGVPPGSGAGAPGRAQRDPDRARAPWARETSIPPATARIASGGRPRSTLARDIIRAPTADRQRAAASRVGCRRAALRWRVLARPVRTFQIPRRRPPLPGRRPPRLRPLAVDGRVTDASAVRSALPRHDASSPRRCRTRLTGRSRRRAVRSPPRSLRLVSLACGSSLGWSGGPASAARLLGRPEAASWGS